MHVESTDAKRRHEIIEICLRKFLEKGLYETTSRDLTDALNMRPSALYYYFRSKDHAVLECAEEAAIRLEESLMLPALNRLENVSALVEQPEDVAEQLQAMTRFFAQVCTANKYRQQMQPVLARLRQREAAYCAKFAQKLGCTQEELAPWFFAVTASTQNYMILGEEAYSVKPLDFTNTLVRLFREKYKTTDKQIEKDDINRR